MARQSTPYLADPSALVPYNKDKMLQVIIETPKNSHNKYAFDHDRHVIVLRKILPAGMIFPYDFGFVPSTLTDDGDPLDVLLLMDEPAVPGCVLDARVIGVIEGQDELTNGKTQRNDRVLAVASSSHAFEDVKTIENLPRQLVENIQEFFVNYPRMLGGKTYKILGSKGPEDANKLIEQAHRNA